MLPGKCGPGRSYGSESRHDLSRPGFLGPLPSFVQRHIKRRVYDLRLDVGVSDMLMLVDLGAALRT